MHISAVHRITYTHVHDRLTPSKFTLTGHSGLLHLQNPNCRATTVCVCVRHHLRSIKPT
jgi:hypothetical protein